MDLDTPPGDGPPGPSAPPKSVAEKPTLLPASGRASATVPPQASGDLDKAPAASGSNPSVNPTLLPASGRASATGEPNVSGGTGSASAASGPKFGHPSVPSSSSDGGAGATSVSPPATASSSGARAGDRKDSDAKRARRERREAEDKKVFEEVRLALWPTPELVKHICEQSGEEVIEYKRVLDSIRFRDAWKRFKAQSRPTARDVTDLRRLAIETLGKRKGKPHRNSGKKPSPGDKGTKSEHNRSGDEYDKRKRDSSSSSAGSGKLKQPFKIPKVGSSSSVDTEKATLPEDNMDTGSGDGDDIVEAESEYAPLEHFTHDVEGALPKGDFAAATSGKKRRLEYPFLLYVHKGRTLREKIPKEAWNLFKERFNEVLVEATLADEPTPDIDWTGYKAGTGVVATTDEWSRDKAKDIIDTIEVAELQFRAYPKGARDEKTTVSIKIPPEFKNIDEQKLCLAIEKKNKLQLSGTWEFFTCRSIKGSGERLLRVIVDDGVIATIKEKLDGRLKIASRQLEVFQAGKRLG